MADEATGVATLYNGAGAKQSLVVTIPKSNPTDPTFPTGTPTGTISNANTTDFPAAPNKPAAFIFATLDGSIAAWNPTVAVAFAFTYNSPMPTRQGVAWLHFS